MDSADDSWVVSVVKIEIDIAEEPPSTWRTERGEQGEKSHWKATKKEWEQCTLCSEKKEEFCLLAKYIPVSCKYGGQKWEWRYPAVCVGSYFIADENIRTYLMCLQSCNMQKHQKANFRTAEYVCVQQWWLKLSITHVSWRVTSWNVRSLSTFASSNNVNRGKTLLLLIGKHCQCRDLNTKDTVIS